jgi:hypothetical protein
MKRLLLLSLTLGLLGLPLHAQNVWSSKIDTFGNYVKQTGNSYSKGVVSVFTPATSITVNRIQLQVAGGQVCTSLPGIKITDGTLTYALAIPNTKAPSGIGPATNDSGPISLAFAANTEIKLKAVPSSVYCNPYEINIVVQYSVP